MTPLERLSKIKALIQEKQNANSTMQPQFWKPSGLLRRISPSRKIQSWLTTPTSLTAKLRVLCPDLQVVILSEEFEIPLLNESQKLGLNRNEEAWIRCVLLKCHGKSWVYARTVIPKLDEHNPWHHLQKLGNKPLGEVLFDLPSIQRSPFEFSKNALSFWPYLIENLDVNEAANLPGFARRSVFKQQNAPLLLTEVFLPGLVD
ncbi:putative chorismate pyruvate-lyase [Thiomicrorhabdus immobilis]|uniref:Probable chorismate pyruvate-lyase n=1 Tax=Thiomicrorhabdus immobilis TaxID=2791037 RepID=A0ABN6D2M9_9GAMM|nr:chorismate lyase [Thiomicrorhabdus immobilis]BCN94427.1 putative chorismate pyruvate-lyase [Thiomicrorhabdus immobilis]